MGMRTSATCATVRPRANLSTMRIAAQQWRHTKHGGAVTVSAGSACALCAGASLSSARQRQIGRVSAVVEQRRRASKRTLGMPG
jgi:hypothetical protein